MVGGGTGGTARGAPVAAVELLVRIRWPSGATDDVRVIVEPTHTVAELLAAASESMAQEWSPGNLVYLERTAALVALDRSIGEAGLVSGDVLRFDLNDVRAPRPAGERIVAVAVVGGPDAGRSELLGSGRFVVGRDRSNALSIGDATVSPQQLVIDVGDDLGVTVSPLPGVENPTLVNGLEVTEARRIRPSDVVQLGATALVVREATTAPPEQRDQLGQIPFNRTPHRPAVVQERVFKPLAGLPRRPEPRRFGVLMVLAPLASGLVLFAFTRQVQFLALTLLSPIALVGNWFDDRTNGRHRYARELERFREQLEQRRADVEAARAAERAERVAAAPDLADLAARAALHASDLWSRDRSDPELLTMRLGLGLVASRVRTSVEETAERALREEAENALAGHDSLPASPVTISLLRLGVVAFAGPRAEVNAMAGAAIVQAATLHSPEDLVVVTIETDDGRLAAWTKWLPHTRSVTSPLGRPHVVQGVRDAEQVIRELVDVGDRRRAARRADADRVDHRWPWVLVVLDHAVGVDAALAAQLFDLCPDAGIAVVTLCEHESRVPRQAKAIVRCLPPAGGQLSTLWSTDPGEPVQQFEPEQATPALTERVALALAALRDDTAATAATAIPRTVGLLTLFAEPVTAASVATEWLGDKPYGLGAPIGMSPNGPLWLDLVEHGPHALIGGTSGAGKSELLQAIVASLAAHHPPTRLTFLFVDYKGGASSKVFDTLPHTVGYVTNLEAGLALRALTSLRAELDRRMALLEGRAKDLAELLERQPEVAPPSLVIVVDEFATLVKEVPDFVAGIVDIAQRGRSLGIHLILATQRPSGAVNDNILANTNLRISLRMLDGNESSSVIGSALAAEIPVPLKGRAFAKLGPGELVPFQSAFAGAPYQASGGPARVHCERFGRSALRDVRRLQPPPAGSVPVHGGVVEVAEHAAPSRTHLDVLLEAVRSALPDLPPPLRPWREVLPDLVTLAELRAAANPVASGGLWPGRHVVIAIADDPGAQDQYPIDVDLEEAGGLLVVGGGGSGRTTALRTIALSCALDATPDEVTIFAIDCASRSLRVLGELPHTSAVATGDDLESITRVVATLDREVDRRRRILSELDVQADTLTAYLDGGRRMPRILLLIDGYHTLAAMLGGLPSDQTGLHDWVADLHRIITDGRAVGIHTVLTVDRRQSVPALLMSAVSERIVLRQSDDQGYVDFGVPTAVAKGLQLEPGRGILPSGLHVQIAAVSAPADGATQGAAITAAGASMSGAVPAALVTAPFPERVDIPLQPSSAGRAVLGLADLTHDVVDIDVSAGFCVVGHGFSGRSTALRTLATSIEGGGRELWIVAPWSVPGAASCVAGDDAATMLGELATLVETYPDVARTLVVDDADLLENDDGAYAAASRILRSKRVHLVGAIQQRSQQMSYTDNPLLKALQLTPRKLVLQPASATEVFTTFDVRPPMRPGLKMSPGRGILIVDRVPIVVQVAVTD